MSVTDNYNLPLPDPNALSAKADVQKIRDALIALDAALANQNVDTYTKSETNSAVAQAKSETKTELLGGVGAAFDTLKELSDARGENVDAITALTGTVGQKADSSALKALAFRDTVSSSYIDSKSISNEHWVDSAENVTGVDWNDVVTNGFWMGSSTTNNPLGSDARWWIGQVVAHNSIWVTQEVWDFTESNPTIYRRYRNNGTWLAWQRVVSSVWEHVETMDIVDPISSVNFANLTPYRDLRLTFMALPDTDNREFWVRLRNSGSSSFTVANYQYQMDMSYSSGTSYNASQNATHMRMAYAIGNNTYEGCRGTIVFTEFNNSRKTVAESHMQSFNLSGQNRTWFVCASAPNAVNDALRLRFNSGNVSKGHFVLEGVRG